MISEKKSGAPYLNVWFGNFYRPAYDDQAFVAEGMELLKKQQCFARFQGLGGFSGTL